MKKIILLSVFFLIFCSFIFADEYATTDSGKRVLLREDKTWEYVKNEKSYKVIKEWKGEGNKNTETFNINSNEWIIAWHTKPGKYGEGIFQIFIYDSEGNLIDLAANVIGENINHSVMRKKGNYYLQINSMQPYIIKVCEWK